MFSSTDAQVRQLVLAVAYLVCEQRDLHLELRGFKARKFAGRVFDQALVDAAVGRVQAHMDGLGHPTVLGRPMLTHALTDVMLLAGSPLLGDLGARADLFVTLRSRELNNARRHGVEQLARTLVEMRVLGELPFEPSRRGRSGLPAARPVRSTSPRSGWSGRGGGLRPRPWAARAARTPTTR